jgi:hypothetical protein
VRAPLKKTSSMMMRAPARAIAATPAIQASSAARNSSCTAISPFAANSIPDRFGGRAATNVSTLSASHGVGRIACRQRAIPDLPELDPPLSTMTLVTVSR